MFAIIRRYQGKKGAVQGIGDQVQAELVPLVSTQPGFVSYTAIDAGNDVAVVVSVFRDKASAEAASKIAIDWVQQNMADLGKPEITVGEVVGSNVREL